MTKTKKKKKAPAGVKARANKSERAMSDQQLIAGIQKNLGGMTSLVLEGQERKIADIVAMLQARLAASAPVAAAKASWLTLARAEQKLVADTQPVIDALRRYLVAVNGQTPKTVTEYGFVKPKRRAKKASAQKPQPPTPATPPPETPATAGK
jgi:hypothetical protein